MNFPAATAECALTDVDGDLAVVRRFAKVTLLAWHCGVAIDDALLIITELVTNALRHGAGVPRLRLSVEEGHIRVEVSDDSPVLPVRRAPGPDGGWGLALLDRLSPAWGVTRDGRGKVVWCALPAAAPGPVG